MEDKKVLEFINKHHEESYKDHVKKSIKKNKINTIQCIILFLAMLGLVLVLCSTISQNNKKAVEKCVKMGHTYKYCVRSL